MLLDQKTQYNKDINALQIVLQTMLFISKSQEGVL